MRLGGKAIELLNCNALTAELLARGWNVYLPVYDEGIDLLALPIDGQDTLLRIQLKSRWTIDKKYTGRNIELAFSYQGQWYLAPHDEALEIGRRLRFCDTASWHKTGKYSVPKMSKVLLDAMRPFFLDDRLGPRLIPSP